MTDEFDYASADDLARLIRTRQVSPVEVVRRSLERLDETEPLLNAFVARNDEASLRAARTVEQAVMRGENVGPLAGVPVSVKDLIDVSGMPCRYGSLTMADYAPSEDAPSAARLRAAGAIIIGKTATSEFGLRGYTESPVHGVTRNVWDLSRTPGGSSGGAVTSVAAGVTPIALGTDGGGSVRAPCSLAGLSGIKAQHGRVPVYPPSATPTLAHVGPIARSMADAALVLSVIAGRDLRDHSSLLPNLGPVTASNSVECSRLRVAYSPTLGYARVAPEVAGVVDAAVRQLQSHVPNIVQVDHVCPDPGEILATEFVGGCSARLGDLVDTVPEKIDPVVVQAIEEFRKLPATRLAAVQRQRLEHRKRLFDFFESYDVLLTPTTPTAAWHIGPGVPPGYEDVPVWVFFTYPFNLTGQPAASVPCGFTDDGLPVGLQIVVRPLEEELLIPVACAAEAHLGAAGQRPPWPPRPGATSGSAAPDHPRHGGGIPPGALFFN